MMTMVIRSSVVLIKCSNIESLLGELTTYVLFNHRGTQTGGGQFESII